MSSSFIWPEVILGVIAFCESDFLPQVQESPPMDDSEKNLLASLNRWDIPKQDDTRSSRPHPTPRDMILKQQSVPQKTEFSFRP